MRITRHYGQGWDDEEIVFVLQELTTCTWQSQVPNLGIREELESENYPSKSPITEKSPWVGGNLEGIPRTGKKYISKVPEEKRDIVYSGHGEWPSLAQREGIHPVHH